MPEVVKCPHCGQRLFDLEAGGRAVINIKCPKCKKVSKMELNNKRIA